MRASRGRSARGLGPAPAPSRVPAVLAVAATGPGRVRWLNGYPLRMPKPPLPPEIEEFLARPNPSVIATLALDGSPHSAATWYLWEHGQALVNMDSSRKRLEHLRRDPRVSLTVLDKDEWYRQVTLRGRATLRPDHDLKDIDRIARYYTGDRYPDRERESVSAWIEVESWYGWHGGGFWTGKP